MKAPKTGNIGVITIDDDAALHIVFSNVAGLLYCAPLTGGRVRVILPDQFWVLLDKLQ
jgi:hypothetical protein